MNSTRKLTFLNAALQSARMLIGAIHAVYLTSAGVSLADLAFLQVVFSSVVLVLEFPTGVFADAVSRKTSVLISCCLLLAYYPICFLAPNLIALTISEILYGAAMSLISGAIQGWLVGCVRHEYPNSPDMIAHYNHLGFEAAAFGMMISGPLGAFIAKDGNLRGFRQVYLCASMAMLGLLLAFLRVKEYGVEPGAARRAKRFSDYERALKRGLKAIFGTRAGLYYLGVTALLAAVYQPVFHFWQPLLLEAQRKSLQSGVPGGEPIVILGVTFFAANLFTYAINRLVRKQWLSLHSPARIGSIVSLAAVLSFFGIFYFTRVSSLGYLIGAYCLLRGLLTVVDAVSGSLFYASAPTEDLASSISAAQVVGRGLTIIALYSIGLVLARTSLAVVFGLTAIPMSFIFLLFFSWQRDIKVVPNERFS